LFTGIVRDPAFRDFAVRKEFRDMDIDRGAGHMKIKRARFRPTSSGDRRKDRRTMDLMTTSGALDPIRLKVDVGLD